MGTDKSALEYYGQPQRNYLYHMLQPMCDKVFLSCNSSQLANIPQHYAPLPDAIRYEHTGPMAALLTAWDLYPEAALLAVGCDYPFLRSSDVQHLIYHRRQGALTTCYYNVVTGVYEPLLAIYEPGLREQLIKNYEQGQHSLQHLLKEIDAEQVYHMMPEVTRSIDNKEQYEQVVQQIRSAGF
jgi:molybdopterin-guanine dinucleotide biosynthesis protein A